MMGLLTVRPKVSELQARQAVELQVSQLSREQLVQLVWLRLLR